MGDMADYALEMLAYDDYLQLRLAELRDHGIQLADWEWEFLYDYDGTEFPKVFSGLQVPKTLDWRTQPKTCRCCGQGGLRWDQLCGKWRLFDKHGLHQCPVNPLVESFAEEL